MAYIVGIMSEIAWMTLWPAPLEPGGVCLVAGAKGLLAVELLDRREDRGALLAQVESRWGARAARGRPTPRVSEWLNQARGELEAYFAGSKEPFRVPCDFGRFRGTFSASVWQSLRRIPFGSLVAYGDIASRVARRGAARAVGGAVGRNPFPIVVPCHRVVAGDGKLTGFSSGLRHKVRLLAHEGVFARGNGDLRNSRVSMTRATPFSRE
jgi:methylated-DNA-[protein]-cysteine S-methyltransferase